MNPMVDWQTAYLQQLQRTTGRIGKITQRGSWYELANDHEYSIPMTYRKKDIVEMTERLKTRPDWNKGK